MNQSDTFPRVEGFLLRINETTYSIYCPACQTLHGFNTKPKGWGLEVKAGKPTIHGSLKTEDHEGNVCHAHVKQGKWEYMGGSTHRLKWARYACQEIPTNLLPLSLQ